MRIVPTGTGPRRVAALLAVRRRMRMLPGGSAELPVVGRVPLRCIVVVALGRKLIHKSEVRECLLT
jgi:hypothetical protein